MPPVPLQHVALIPDGNRRWARAHGVSTLEGHRRGMEAVERFLDVCEAYEVSFVTLWALSTENFDRRTPDEIKAITRLVDEGLQRLQESTGRRGKRRVALRHLGRRDRLQTACPALIDRLDYLASAGDNEPDYILNVALDYGGRDEIVRAMRKLVAAGDPIDEAHLQAHLDTAGQPAPDLIIRTSGEWRTSGLLPFQAAYSEYYFTSRLLPDLSTADVEEAFAAYQRRERRHGGDHLLA